MYLDELGSLVQAFPESSDQFLLKRDWTVVQIHATVNNANQFWRSWNYLFNLALKFSLYNFLPSNTFTVSEAVSWTTGLDCTHQLGTLPRAATSCQLHGWLRGCLFLFQVQFFILYLLFSYGPYSSCVRLALFISILQIKRNHQRLEILITFICLFITYVMCWSQYLNPGLLCCKCPMPCSS